MPIAIVCCAVVATGCRRRDHDPPTIGQTGAVEVERVALETTVTSGVVDRVDTSLDESLRLRAEALAAFRRDELDYQRRLEGEIDRLDRELATEADAARAHAARARRAVLVKDIEAIDRSTTQDWPWLKVGLDRHLNGRATGR